MQKSSGIEETGTIVWQLALALGIAWIGVYAMVIKGIHVGIRVIQIEIYFF